MAQVQKVAKNPFLVEVGPRREGDAPYLVAKNDRIKEKLAFAPRYDDLELICQTALDWEATLS